MGSQRRWIVLAAAALFLTQGVGEAAAVGSGAPDASFGHDGQMTVDAAGYEYPTAMAVFPDGAVALALETSHELVVVRITAAGAPDRSFGSNGTLRPLPGKLAGAPAMFATREGGLLIAAWVGEDVGGVVVKPHLVLMKLRADGTRDPQFANRRGVATFARDVVKPMADYTLHAAMTRDGGIVVLGIAGVSLGYFGFPAVTGLVRFGPNGHVDPSFGVRGFVPVEAPTVLPGTYRVTVDSQDRIVVGTTDWTLGAAAQTLRVLGLTPAGRPDVSFGRGGVRSFTFGGDWNSMTALTVDYRDRVLVAGYGSASVVGSVTKALLRPTEPVLGFTPAVARLTPRGSLDASFGARGVARLDRDQRGRTLTFSDALTTDEVGRPILNALAERSLSLIRLTTSGAVDASFDQPSLPIDSWIQLRAHRGRILCAGYREEYRSVTAQGTVRFYETVVAAYRG